MTSINTPLPLKMYTSALKKTVNWDTLVSLLVEYHLYSVIPVLDFPGLDTVEQKCSLTVYYGSILDRNDG